MSRGADDGRSTFDKGREYYQDYKAVRDFAGLSKSKNRTKFNQDLTKSTTADSNNKLPLEAANPTERVHGERSRETPSGAGKKPDGTGTTDSDFTKRERQNFSKRNINANEPNNKKNKNKRYADFQNNEKPPDTSQRSINIKKTGDGLTKHEQQEFIKSNNENINNNSTEQKNIINQQKNHYQNVNRSDNEKSPEALKSKNGKSDDKPNPSKNEIKKADIDFTNRERQNLSKRSNEPVKPKNNKHKNKRYADFQNKVNPLNTAKSGDNGNHDDKNVANGKININNSQNNDRKNIPSPENEKLSEASTFKIEKPIDIPKSNGGDLKKPDNDLTKLIKQEHQNFSKRKDDNPSIKNKQKLNRYYNNFQPKDKPSDKAETKTENKSEGITRDKSKITDKSAEIKPKTKLQFGKDDLKLSDKAEKGLQRTRIKADKSADKFDKAIGKLSDKQRLKFDKTGKLPSAKSKSPNKAFRLGKDAVHSKVSECENDNTGVQAAHEAEQTGEKLYRGVRSAYRHVKEKPLRKAQKAGSKTFKNRVNYEYKSALNNNPKLKSNPFSRMMQKKNIRKQYAKASKGAKNTAKTAQKTGDITVKAGKAVISAATKHPIFLGIIIVGFLLACVISTMLAPASVIGGGASSAFSGAYPAGETEINSAELFYTELETDYKVMLNDIPQTQSGYDEYRYHVSNISHNPHEIISFLSAYYGEFSYGDATDALEYIFEQRYDLTLTESTETRYYTVTYTDDEGEEHSEEISYSWNILHVYVTARTFKDVVYEYMDDEQKKMYEAYLMTGGGRQYVGNPIDYNWYSDITCNFGYRIHPISGDKNYHKGIDIAMPENTNLYAAISGTVTAAGYDEGGYGYYITVKDENSVEIKYAHCNFLLKNIGDSVEAGDMIAKSGNTGQSTGAHLHFEIISNGVYMNPIFFSDTGNY